jgi:hypothetical protein
LEAAEAAATDDSCDSSKAVATSAVERGPVSDHPPAKPSARSVRQDRVRVPAGDDASMYATAGYSRRDARDIDEIVIGALCSAVAGMGEPDWERLMRRIDMVRSERRATAA